MKKHTILLTLAMTIMSFLMNSQPQIAYTRNSPTPYVKFLGTRISYKNVLASLALDSSGCCSYVDADNTCYINGLQATPNDYVFYDTIMNYWNVYNPVFFNHGYTTSLPYAPVAQTYTVTRSIASSTYIISSSKEAYVDYDVDISATVTLLSGSQSATLVCEYSTDGGSTWKTQANPAAGQNLSLAISISLTQTQTVKLTGWIPANARVRIVKSGTATASWRFGKERY